MNRFLSIGLETLPAAVLLLLLFLLLGKPVFHSVRRTGWYLLLALYLAAAYLAVGLPTVTYLRFDPSISLIPLAGLAADGTNALLNVLLFVPLGAFLPLLWEGFRSVRRTILFGFSLSLFIEVLQLFTFRASDVNDLLTNTLGTALGYSLAAFLLKHAPARFPADGESRDLPLVFGAVFLVMSVLSPLLSSLPGSL